MSPTRRRRTLLLLPSSPKSRTVPKPNFLRLQRATSSSFCDRQRHYRTTQNPRHRSRRMSPLIGNTWNSGDGGSDPRIRPTLTTALRKPEEFVLLLQEGTELFVVGMIDGKRLESVPHQRDRASARTGIQIFPSL